MCPIISLYHLEHFALPANYTTHLELLQLLQLHLQLLQLLLLQHT